MFTLPKTDFPRQFHVYADNVREQLGGYSGEYPDLYMSIDDEAAAISVAYRKHISKIEADLSYKKSVLSYGRGWIYAAKSLWIKKTKEQLIKHKLNIHELEMALEYDEKDDTVVIYMPKDLEFEGTLLPLGTEIYRVDSYNADFRVSVITGYKAYDWEKPLHYSNSGQFLITSTTPLNGRKSKEQYALFLNKQGAEAYCKEVIKDQMLKMQEKLKQLGE